MTFERDTPDDECASRGPRIGNEGVPVCRLAPGHSGRHRPRPEDGWGSGMEWTDLRGVSTGRS